MQLWLNAVVANMAAYLSPLQRSHCNHENPAIGQAHLDVDQCRRGHTRRIVWALWSITVNRLLNRPG